MTWHYKTAQGTFQIKRLNDNKFHIIYDNDSLGGYPSPQSAAEELADGTSFWPSCGDPEELDIPEDLDDWEQDF